MVFHSKRAVSTFPFMNNCWYRQRSHNVYVNFKPTTWLCSLPRFSQHRHIFEKTTISFSSPKSSLDDAPFFLFCFRACCSLVQFLGFFINHPVHNFSNWCVVDSPHHTRDLAAVKRVDFVLKKCAKMNN